MTTESGKHGRRFPVSGVGFIALALVAAGCSEDRRFATASATKDTGKLVVPARITPPVTVARIDGAPKGWRLNARVAKALRDRDVPAGTHGRGKASYTLNGRLETLAPRAAGAAGAVPRLRIAWTLHDAQGKRVGGAIQLAAHPVAADVKIDANIDKKPDPVALDRLARMAAERLTPLVPHAAVSRDQTARAQITRAQGPIWRRVVGAPVTALGKQDARRGGTSLSARFLKLRHVTTVAAATPEARIAAKRRAKELAAAPAVTPNTTKTATAPVLKPDGPAASGTALTRRSVVTERIAFVAANPSSHRPATSRPVKARPVTATVAARPAVTRIAAHGPVQQRITALRKDAAIRPAPGAAKFPATARPVEIAEAAGGRAAANTKGFWVQLASNPSARASRAAWTALVAAHGPLLERQPHAVNRADLGRKGVYYRLQLGPYPNIAQARRICANLRAARVACLLMAARGQVAARTPASRRVVTKPLTPTPQARAPKARAPKARPPKARPPKAKAAPPKATGAKAKRPAGKARSTAPTKARGRPDSKSANRSPAGKAVAGKASAVRPAAGARRTKPAPKSGAKPSARSSIRSDSGRRPGSATKPGFGARAEKPKSRADKLPFQRSKVLPGLPD